MTALLPYTLVLDSLANPGSYYFVANALCPTKHLNQASTRPERSSSLPFYRMQFPRTNVYIVFSTSCWGSSFFFNSFCKYAGCEIGRLISPFIQLLVLFPLVQSVLSLRLVCLCTMGQDKRFFFTPLLPSQNRPITATFLRNLEAGKVRKPGTRGGEVDKGATKMQRSPGKNGGNLGGDDVVQNGLC